MDERSEAKAEGWTCGNKTREPTPMTRMDMPLDAGL
jgi:hypothetical protein